MTDIKSKLLSKLEPGALEERCGLVMADGSVIDVTNVSGTPELGFRMDAQELLDNVDRAISTWHTHPDTDPNLSEEDYAGFLQWPKLSHFIVGLRAGKPAVTEFVVNDGLVVAL